MTKFVSHSHHHNHYQSIFSLQLDSDTTSLSTANDSSVSLLSANDSSASLLANEIKLAESAIQSLRKAYPESNPHLQSLENTFVSMVQRLKEVSKSQAKPTAEVKGHRVFNRVAASSKTDSTKVGERSVKYSE